MRKSKLVPNIPQDWID